MKESDYLAEVLRIENEANVAASEAYAAYDKQRKDLARRFCDENRKYKNGDRVVKVSRARIEYTVTDAYGSLRDALTPDIMYTLMTPEGSKAYSWESDLMLAGAGGVGFIPRRPPKDDCIMEVMYNGSKYGTFDPDEIDQLRIDIAVKAKEMGMYEHGTPSGYTILCHMDNDSDTPGEPIEVSIDVYGGMNAVPYEMSHNRRAMLNLSRAQFELEVSAKTASADNV